MERPIPGTPQSARLEVPFRRTLGNGLRLVCLPRKTLPQVALRIVLPGGSAGDLPGAEGLAALTGGMLTEGTETHPADALNRRLDRLGASLAVHVGHDFVEIDLLLLRETVPEGLELLAGVLARPTFPESELARLQRETIDALEARLDEPANVADDAMGHRLYGDDHPYGRLTLGTAEGVAAIERSHLTAFHRRHFGPEGAVLIAAGDLDPERFAALVERRLADWAGRAELPVYPAEPEQASREPIVIPWEEAQQTELRVGGPGMTRDSRDWIPASVANYLLGGSTITGRLGANLRELRGWTYGIRSGFSAALQRGSWGIETAVDAEVAAAAMDEIRLELTRFLAEPVPADELQRARDALVLSLPRAFETPGRIVSRLATVEVFGLEEDYWQRFPERVAAVNRDDVLRMAHRYFDPARLHTVMVGP